MGNYLKYAGAGFCQSEQSRRVQWLNIFSHCLLIVSQSEVEGRQNQKITPACSCFDSAQDDGICT